VLLIALLSTASFLLAAAEREIWKRVSQTPVISPQGTGWESAGTFNPAVIRHDNKVVMLYRAQDTDGVSRLGYADSTDGIHFARKPEPVFAPEGSYEIGGGVEDPRRVKIDRLYYVTYTGYNKQDAQLCLATSRDLIHWDRKGAFSFPHTRANGTPHGPNPAPSSRKKSTANIGCTGWEPRAIIMTRWASPTPTIWFTGPKRQKSPCSRPARENSIPASSSPARRRFSLPKELS
jgi:hypothetical protein